MNIIRNEKKELSYGWIVWDYEDFLDDNTYSLIDSDSFGFNLY